MSGPTVIVSIFFLKSYFCSLRSLEKKFYVAEKYLVNLTKVCTFPYIIKTNQICFLKLWGRRSPPNRHGRGFAPCTPSPPLKPFPPPFVPYLSILLLQHVPIPSSRNWTFSIPLCRHSNYLFRTYFAKNFACDTEIGHFGTRPMHSVFAPNLLNTQYTILCGGG